jgi:acetyl esterase/lipase
MNNAASSLSRLRFLASLPLRGVHPLTHSESSAFHTNKNIQIDNFKSIAHEIPAVWFYTRKSRQQQPITVSSSNRCVLYLHGGGYIAGSVASYRGWVSHFAQLTKLPFVAIDYRLAPEHPFPHALVDGLSTYLSLVNDHGISPQDITLMGDSAGGGLAISMALWLREHSYHYSPGKVVAISPWVFYNFRCQL